MPLAEFAQWKAVAEDAELLRRAAEVDPTRVAELARLRKRYAAWQVAVALDLIRGRAKAAGKFPGRAAAMLADADGVEQATAEGVARHKGRTLRAGGVGRVLDVGCGIGGDAMGMVAEGLEVLAVDRDATRAAMAGHHAGCAFAHAEARDLLAEARPDVDQRRAAVAAGHAGGGGGSPLSGWPPSPVTAVHLDPARRGKAGRTRRLADHEPDPETIRRLRQRYEHLAIKLSPAVDLAELAETYDLGQTRLEFISDAGRLVQAMLYTGRLAAAPPAGTHRHDRTATLLAEGQTHQLHGSSVGGGSSLEIVEARRYLFAVDAAVERAGLLAELGLPAIHPRLGLLTADDLEPVAAEDPRRPWLTGFELLADLPWHAEDPRQVRGWLAEHDSGLVEVKTRGKAVDPDVAQQQLRGGGSRRLTVFVLRFDRRLRALVTRRVGTGDD